MDSGTGYVMTLVSGAASNSVYYTNEKFSPK